MNIKLQIGEDIIDYLKNDNVPMHTAGSVIAILMALYHDNYKFLNYFDDSNREKQIMLLYQMLLRKGYIEETQEEELEEALYKLTKKGENFIKYAEMTAMTIDIKEDPLETWIDEYINIFPEPVRGQRNLRGDRNSCLIRMRWFLSKYKYSKDHILAATEEYINSQAASQDGHKYTVTSDYFIKKGSGTDLTSRLAQACESYDPNNITIKQDYSRDTI